MPRALVSAPTARRPVQAASAQALVDGAKRLASLKPSGLRQTQVMAIVGFPDMFQSEICIFFDPDDVRAFTHRDTAEQRWTPAHGVTLVQGLDLVVPDAFQVRGFDTVHRDDTFDPPYVEEGQIWLIGELGDAV